MRLFSVYHAPARSRGARIPGSGTAGGARFLAAGLPQMHPFAVDPIHEHPAAARRLFLAAAVLTLTFRAWFAWWLPFTGDEAYFLTWGRNPQWGFYDHPPMIGWLLAALSQVSDRPFALRLPALLAPVVVAALVQGTLARHGQTLAWNAATLTLLAPLNLWNVAITTDVPLMLFCAGTVAAYVRAQRTGRAVDYLLAGLLLGGALLSKYFAGLMALAILAHVLAQPSRARLAGLALIVLASLPAVALQIAWNAQNCWPNLMFNLVNRHGSAGLSWRSPLLYAVSFAYVLTPPVAWWLLRGRRALPSGPAGVDNAVSARTADAHKADARSALAWLCGFPLALLAAVSVVRTVGLHWLASFVAPALMLFALGAPARAMRAALRVAVALAVVHYVAIAALAIAPLDWFRGWRGYDGLVMTLRPEALNQRIAPYLDRFQVAAPGYSPAVTLGFNLGRYVFVFGPGSSHARHDDILTDFRRLAGRDLLVVAKEPPRPQDYEPFFERVVFRDVEVLGASFHFVEGYGFRYDAYREQVLDEIRRRWYAVPPWLPAGPCYFCDRYFPERACRR